MTGPDWRPALILVTYFVVLGGVAIFALKRRMDRLRAETKELRHQGERLRNEVTDRIIPMLQRVTDTNEQIGHWLGTHRHAEAGPPPELEDDDELTVVHISAAAMRNDLLELKAELEQASSSVEAG
jgi:hypothetical protein